MEQCGGPGFAFIAMIYFPRNVCRVLGRKWQWSYAHPFRLVMSYWWMGVTLLPPMNIMISYLTKNAREADVKVDRVSEAYVCI